jgi:hypothetical protein
MLDLVQHISPKPMPIGQQATFFLHFFELTHETSELENALDNSSFLSGAPDR